jgi:hypothetical protein
VDANEPGRRASLVRTLAAAGGVLVALGLGAVAWTWHADHAYVGSERRVELRWSCDREADWTDVERGIRWRTEDVVGLDRRRKGMLPGTVRFDDREHATFTADGGGTLRWVRQPNMLAGSCVIS